MLMKWKGPLGAAAIRKSANARLTPPKKKPTGALIIVG